MKRKAVEAREAAEKAQKEEVAAVASAKKAFDLAYKSSVKALI
jgi:hypothetical protein